MVISASAYIKGGSRRASRAAPGAHQSFSSGEPGSANGTGAHQALCRHGGLHGAGGLGRAALEPGLLQLARAAGLWGRA